MNFRATSEASKVKEIYYGQIKPDPKQTRLASAIAGDFRLRAARSLSAGHNDSKSLATSQHIRWFEEYLGLNKIDIAFNEAVTDLALDYVISDTKGAADLLEIGSKVIEQTYFNFFTANSEKPKRNLALAKKYGTFYTPLPVAMRMAEYLLAAKRSSTLIEPCSGSGILSGAVIISQAGSKNGYSEFFLIEKDGGAVAWSQRLLTALVSRMDCLNSVKLNYLEGDAAIRLLRQSQGEEKQADIIMNPPYGRIRFTKDTVKNSETRAATLEAAKRLTAKFDRENESTRILFSELGAGTGLPEYSKIFTLLAARCAKRGSSAVLIGPDSWLAGKDGTALRKFILEGNLLSQLHLYPESSRLFETVNQSTAIVALDNKKKAEIKVSKDAGPKSSVAYDQAIHFIPVGIPLMESTSVDAILLKKLDGFQKFASVPSLRNQRGEVDQTKFSPSMRVHPTSLRLVRGEHIQRFVFKHFSDSKKPGYIENSATGQIGPKLVDSRHWRIVGRQCSYAKQARRLIFSLVPPDCLVGNSCNYISLVNCEELTVWAWLGVLNSCVLNWFFRQRNSNNHVANYEIDNLPAPAWTDSQMRDVATLSRSITRALENGKSAQAELLESILEAYICSLFHLSDEEVSLVLSDEKLEIIPRIKSLARKISNGLRIPFPVDSEFFNHDFPRLSDLDMLMIHSVPEGGNWQNIPEAVPSARLAQIREMSRTRGVVRTTYYGRLRRDQPSYTISTYFNRPGNGTHIHPQDDRTLTCREAARLQSFPDSYIFFGPEGAIRNQIGNAVPPLLARAIGNSLLSLTPHRASVDVFCGAGGMSTGLEAAGWHSVAGVDIDQSALQTYAFNRPSALEDESQQDLDLTLVLRKDLHSADELTATAELVKAKLNGRPLGLLAGGPPCQGFSHAGFRAKNDVRNDLAVAYLKLAQELQPDVFLLENVEGLLTFQGGRVVTDITRTLREIGYEVAPIWKLAAEEYGVPQMRRRVFIIGTKSGLKPVPPAPTHSRCPGRWKNKAINQNLPEPITVEEAFSGLSLPVKDTASSDFLTWLESYVCKGANQAR